MAGYNEILSGRYNRCLQKLLSMKGPASVNELSSVITPAFSFFWGAEMRYLEGWDRFGISFPSLAVAAQNSNIRFRNPAGSNVVACIEKISAIIIPGANDVLFLDNLQPDADLTGPAGGFGLDPRSRVRSTCLVSATNNLTVGNTFGMMACTTSQVAEFIVSDIQEIAILPGANFAIRTLGVNEVLRIAVMWRERALEESERT